MKHVLALFATVLSLATAFPAAAQDSPPPAEPDPAVRQPAPQAGTRASRKPAAQAELRQRLADLKVQRERAVSRLKETRAAFQSGQVELKIKASHLRSARAENNPVRARELEKEIAPLRKAVRASHQTMLEALTEVKRLRDETREVARALGNAKANEG